MKNTQYFEQKEEKRMKEANEKEKWKEQKECLWKEREWEWKWFVSVQEEQEEQVLGHEMQNSVLQEKERQERERENEQLKMMTVAEMERADAADVCEWRHRVVNCIWMDLAMGQQEKEWVRGYMDVEGN